MATTSHPYVDRRGPSEVSVRHPENKSWNKELGNRQIFPNKHFREGYATRLFWLPLGLRRSAAGHLDNVEAPAKG